MSDLATEVDLKTRLLLECSRGIEFLHAARQLGPRPDQPLRLRTTIAMTLAGAMQVKRLAGFMSMRSGHKISQGQAVLWAVDCCLDAIEETRDAEPADAEDA